MQTLYRMSIGILGGCGLALLGVVTQRSLTDYEDGRALATTVADWATYHTSGNLLGPENAPVKVVVFSDYQCPFSRELSARLGELLSELPTKLSVRYRHFPLGGHERARLAARAASCAGEQGRFRELHELLTAVSPEVFRTRSMTTFALESGVRDTAVFARCLESEEVAAAIEADLRQGRRLGMPPTTPTFLVNDQKYTGLPPDLEDIIHAAVREVSK